MTDQLHIGKYTFDSRLFVGTGKHPSIPVMQAAHAASGAQVLTVAIRRIHLDDPSGKTMIVTSIGRNTSCCPIRGSVGP
jgi:thiazole synthase